MSYKSKMSIKEKLFFRRKIDEETGCWLWTGSCDGKGYGLLGINGRLYKVHRLSYQEFTGLLIINQVLHKQICPNKHCFNPEHLYDGTHQDNMNDRNELGHQVTLNKFKTHCKYGHEYNESNTYITPEGARQCKECKKDRDKIYRITN